MGILSKERLASRVFIGLILAHMLLISLQVPLGSRASYFERAVFHVFSPLQKGVQVLFRGLGRFWTNYFYLLHVQKQNQALRREVFSLRQENRELRTSLEKIQSLREVELHLSQAHGTFVPASVIGMDFQRFYKSVVIDKGTWDGIRKDMVVLDRYGNLVGRVVEPVSLKASSVQLITDDESGVSVFVEGDKGLGVLAGDGRGRCLLKYILDTNEDIREGDVVRTTGYDRIYPWGIPAGKVVALSSDSSLFKRVRVQPLFHFRDLSEVAVLLSEEPR